MCDTHKSERGRRIGRIICTTAVSAQRRFRIVGKVADMLIVRGGRPRRPADGRFRVRAPPPAARRHRQVAADGIRVHSMFIRLRSRWARERNGAGPLRHAPRGGEGVVGCSGVSAAGRMRRLLNRGYAPLSGSTFFFRGQKRLVYWVY